MRPTECKYCGCEEVATKTESEIVFRCWSSYLSADGYWTVSNNCGARCAVQLVELRERIQRAVEVLGGWEAVRFYRVIHAPHGQTKRRRVSGVRAG